MTLKRKPGATDRRIIQILKDALEIEAFLAKPTPKHCHIETENPALTRFLQLVEIIHGPPKNEFKETADDAFRMLRSLFKADSEGEIVPKILADQKGAWSLFKVCIPLSGVSVEVIRLAPVFILDQENLNRTIPGLIFAIPRHQFG